MRNTILSVVLISLIGCNSTSKEESANARPTVLEAGREIALAAKKNLGGNLKNAIQEGGVSYAVNYCKVNAASILNQTTTEIEAKIRRASFRWRNPQDRPMEEERKILEDYLIRMDEGRELEDRVVDLGNGKVLFASPILLDNPLCLNCHGAEGSQITEETLTLLKKLYPEDRARGHKMGDLRGIWSITFASKDVLLD